MIGKLSYIGPSGSGRRGRRINMENVLLVGLNGKSGGYAVADGFESKAVIAFHRNAGEAVRLARGRGAVDPVLIYVPSKPETAIVF